MKLPSPHRNGLAGAEVGGYAMGHGLTVKLREQK